MTRLEQEYDKIIRPNLMKEFGLKNINQVPKLKKIVLNMGLGEDVIKDNLPKRFYKIQKTLSNGKRVDCLLDFGTKGTAIAIDSKFPMPKKLLNSPEDNEKKILEREFNTVITKHYTEISEKYIIHKYLLAISSRIKTKLAKWKILFSGLIGSILIRGYPFGVFLLFVWLHESSRVSIIIRRKYIYAG